MVIDYLQAFISRCDKQNVIPNELHISAYLAHVNKLDYFEPFVLFCFYGWDLRHEEDIERLFLQILVNRKIND
jgi:hypothetical protein